MRENAAANFVFFKPGIANDDATESEECDKSEQQAENARPLHYDFLVERVIGICS
jgi:hypothetical protein